MGFPVPNLNTNETATSGARATGGGDLSGGTAFNIGGINFGTNEQNPQLTPVPAQNGVPGVTAIQSLSSQAFLVPVLIVGAGLAIWLLLRK